MARTKLHEVAELGQSIWYDNIRRGLLRSGELGRMVERGVRGVTSNPTIFEKAIAGSTDYDDALRRLVAESRGVDHIYDDLVVEDIRAACDVLRPVYEGSDGIDGRVSIEVSPALAHDADETVAEAARLWRAVGRDNLLVKIPATEMGLPAIREATARGVPINVTLIFSIDQYRRVADAYLSGLADRLAQGKSLGHVLSVASFFVSRIDTAVDKLLHERMRAGGADGAAAEALLGTVAIANAKLAYQAYLEIKGSERFRGLAEHGARPQRLLWGSTGTKDPAYPDTLYLDGLIGPDTVNTVPDATLTAFLDHGTPRVTLTEGVAEARERLDRLAALGIDLDEVCGTLLHDGVEAFETSMSTLLEVISARREAILEQAPARQTFRAGRHGDAVGRRTAWLDEQRAPERLWAHDPTLFSDDRAHDPSIRGRLGWLSAPDLMDGQIDELRDLADEARRDGLTDAVLLGMGGSSLCPEVLARTFGPAPGHLRLHVLDNTDPEAVRAVERAVDLSHALFLVASKSGATVEVGSFERHFFARARAALGARAGTRFVAITDPGTPLEAHARERGYRQVFLNPADIGGRYSAISYFGLVPAALLGVDLDALVGDAQRMAVACAACVPAADNPGVRLGGFLGALAAEGRDKLTLIANPEVAALGAWIEQLVAESTGKLGKGIVPVDGEPPGDPDRYGDDRVFAYLRYGNGGGMDARVEALAAAGHPVARIGMLASYDLGGEFVRWEVATAIAGACLRVNPFDEPDVSAAKQATADALAEFARNGRLPAEKAAAPGDAAVIDHLRSARAGDYLALCAYLPRSDGRDAVFSDIRRALRDGTRRATTLGYGPRFLHSTGQLHKGGANNGVFVQLTCDAAEDLPIPGEKHGFGVLRDAQALGDLRVLRERGRRVLRVHLGADPDAGLRALRDRIAGASWT